MDERQTQVVSGAGLQESRINTEFVDFLSKWGPRALYVLLAIVLCFLGFQQWKKYQIRQTDQAFADYEAQLASQNPDLLLKVAEQHTAQPSVWALAMRDAANLLVISATVGTNPGADPVSPKPEDMMTPAQRTAMFQKAESLFRDLLAQTRDDSNRFIFAEQARWGIVSALLSQGKNDDAKKVLQEFISTAEAKNQKDLVALGKERLARLDTMAAMPVIVAQAALPDSALRGGRAPKQSTIEVKPGDETTANSGTDFSIQKIDPPTPPPSEDSPLPESTETPAPAPAPVTPPAKPGNE